MKAPVIYIALAGVTFLSRDYILQEPEDQQLAKSVANTDGCGVYSEVTNVIKRCQQQAMWDFCHPEEMCAQIV